VDRPAQNHRRAATGLSANACSLAVRATGVLALVLLVSVAPAAASSRQAVRTEASPPKVIRLISSTVNFRVLVDKPPQGNSKGDTVYTASVLTNAVAQFGARKGTVIGSDAGRTTNVGGIPMTVNILVALPGGTLRVRGRSRAVGQTRVAPVLGGTGKFKGATGTLTVVQLPRSPDFSNVYRLRYSSGSRAVASRG
jgi:hypothetical protein